MLKDYGNLLIMRTLSKIGLAALRVGFLVGSEEVLKQVNKVRLPFNVNSFSQAVAADALRRGAVVRSSIKKVIDGRATLMREMGRIEGITPYPSEANFILFRTDDPNGVYEGLLRRGILVRNIAPVVAGCLRVTVGRPEENAAFLKALREITG